MGRMSLTARRFPLSLKERGTKPSRRGSMFVLPGKRGESMSVSRGLVLTAFLAMSAGILLPTSSSAQRYEAARRLLDLSPDPIARSPRLLGMGRLTLADDRHNNLGMWDFAANPTG